MEPFQVHILAADQTFYEGPCLSLTIPASDGELGILAHHSPMIAAVKPGTLRYQIPGEEPRLAAISPGMVKVEKNDVLVLVDSAERPEDIERSGPSGRRTRPGRPCCKSGAGRSIRLPRPPWPGR